MKQLWAPWRMEYIKKGGISDSCIFCTGDKEDRGALILYCGRHSGVMMNKYPYSNGHLLIFPRRHVKELEELDTEEGVSLFSMLKESTAILKEVSAPEGFNIGINTGKTAGAGIEDHLHIHLVPRWNGDTNFMPIIGETKVISEHILMTYDSLMPYFKGIERTL
ncbi:MAG: HIT domain-containing protein [Thermodesulfobacteriota bacterium]